MDDKDQAGEDKLRGEKIPMPIRILLYYSKRAAALFTRFSQRVLNKKT